MMTPDSILNKHFDKATMGGYRQDDVDEFLEQVAMEFKAVQAEKEDLERKMEVLATKIEEYREDEDSLRSAILGAQKLGDSLIREAKAKAETILRDAKIEAAQIQMDASKIVENAQKSVEIEKNTLEEMKKEVNQFKKRILDMYKDHFDLISALPEFAEKKIANETSNMNKAETAKEQAAAVPTVEEEVVLEVPVQEQKTQFSMDKDDTLMLNFSDMIDKDPEPSKPAKPAKQNLPFSEIPTPSSENSSSKFGHLKFGDGFDVERNEKKGGMFGRRKPR